MRSVLKCNVICIEAQFVEILTAADITKHASRINQENEFRSP